MYCRICYYDLRGQIDPRCPECGGPFDPHNALTFLSEIPTFASRLRSLGLRIGRALRITAAVVVALMIPACVLIPSLTDCRRPDYMILPMINLNHIASIWPTAAAKDSHHWEPRDRDYLFEPRLSLHQDQEFLRARRQWIRWFREDVVKFLLPIAFFGTIEVFLLRTWVRKLIALAVGLAILLMVGSAVMARFVESIWPGDKSYLRDYAYVPVSKWIPVESLKGSSIVAYQVRGAVGNRAVALKGGGATYLSEDLLMEAAAAQGFELESAMPPE